MLEEILFVSDCHLQKTDSDIFRKLQAFLNHEARRADKLYILGDLFDYWIGDDDGMERFPELIVELKFLSKHTNIFFMHGNHDFLVGPMFAKATGCQILQQPICIACQDMKLLLLHGDTLCTLDRAYQRYRAFTYHPLSQKAFLKIGLGTRQKIYQKLRAVSRHEKRKKPVALLDVAEHSVTELTQQYRADKIIHGHTHLPNRHPMRLADRSCERIVLGDWEKQANYLRLANHSLEYIQI